MFYTVELHSFHKRNFVVLSLNIFVKSRYLFKSDVISGIVKVWNRNDVFEKAGQTTANA